MIAYHLEVPKFQMVLGEVMKNDTKVLIRVKYDVAHSPFGWHVHSFCEDSSLISSGMIKPLGQKRMPAAKTSHRRSEYTLSGDLMNESVRCRRKVVPIQLPAVFGDLAEPCLCSSVYARLSVPT